MRLIDADALKDLEELEYTYFKSPAAVPFYEAHKVWEILDNAPTIDAVPVVRCKDCKHMAVVGVGFRWCKAWERMQTMGDDGFCCFGERRSDGEDD